MRIIPGITWHPSSRNASCWTHISDSDLTQFESIKKLSMKKEGTFYRLAFTIKTEISGQILPDEFIALVEDLTNEKLSCTTRESSEGTLITYSVNCIDKDALEKFNNALRVLKEFEMVPKELNAPSFIDKPAIHRPSVTFFETKPFQLTRRIPSAGEKLENILPYTLLTKDDIIQKETATLWRTWLYSKKLPDNQLNFPPPSWLKETVKDLKSKDDRKADAAQVAEKKYEKHSEESNSSDNRTRRIFDRY